VIDPRNLLVWGEWRPLLSAEKDLLIPALPGLYQIRRAGRADLDYIGQTGMGAMTLRRRLGVLRGVYAEAMPYTAPHTAGPALWALRQHTGEDFLVSVVPVVGETPWRKGFEAMAIALYRQAHRRSPTVEFGRMPVGFVSSSGYTLRLKKARSLFRGEPSDILDASHRPSIEPTGPLNGDPQGAEWGGHAWSGWVPLSKSALRGNLLGSGLYRIRGSAPSRLLYVGQGRIPERPLQHLAKTLVADHRQGQLFAAEDRLECSWVVDASWYPHQRLELECDLIAAHLLVTGEVPAAQFLG